MNVFYNLKDSKTGMYYSEDKVFIEPEKEFAKKLRVGQAKSIAFNQNKNSTTCHRYVLEKADGN